MPPVSSRPRGRFEVRFDDLSFQQDHGHTRKRGREVAVEARERLEREGAATSELLRCQAEHREETELPNCVKWYVTPPGGGWGMVFELVRDMEWTVRARIPSVRRASSRSASRTRRVPPRSRPSQTSERPKAVTNENQTERRQS